jgi:hypothetical protein
MLTLRELIEQTQALAFNHPHLLDSVVQIAVDSNEYDAVRIVREDDMETEEPVAVQIRAL